MKAILTIGHVSVLLDLAAATVVASELKEAIPVSRDYSDRIRYKTEPERITVELEIVTDAEVTSWLS
jgi:hypothetical protein